MLSESFEIPYHLSNLTLQFQKEFSNKQSCAYVIENSEHHFVYHALLFFNAVIVPIPLFPRRSEEGAS